MRWVQSEFNNLDLGDKRLKKRLLRLVSDISENPVGSLPDVCKNPAATKAAYRFLGDPHVNVNDIWDAHARSTSQRLIGEKIVLAVQDTTWLDFTSHPATEGLGYCQRPEVQGMHLHSVLAVSKDGVPLGLLDHKVWVRKVKRGRPKKRHSARRSIEDKESYRWLEGADKAAKIAHDGVKLVTVADREADIYDLLAAPRRLGDELLIRCKHNRDVECGGPKSLWKALDACDVLGGVDVEVKRGNHPTGRSAHVSLSSCELTIKPPRDRAKEIPLAMNAILVREEHPPKGERPIIWRLLTTLPTNSFAKVEKCLRWYTYRWLVERFHYTLKSGCRYEDLQLETADRLQRALPMYAVVAWHLLWLTYTSRVSPALACTIALTEKEWTTLYRFNTLTPKVPKKPPPLSEVIRQIAMLGGFQGRPGDKEPGVKVLWRGLNKLAIIVNAWDTIEKLYYLTPKSPKDVGKE